ncbi:MAG TPA: class I SAM-dependent methyltransferase, partial [Gaiellaceae bacterium]|nr:class I SAM-dependent methyltransferase [Gaiellaceae bacterium]
MKRTTERHSPDRVRTLEDRVTDSLHRFAYSIVKDHARRADRLLEIGFGEGYGAAVVQPWVASYVGVEVDAEAVSHANARYGADSVTFLEYDGATLPFDHASFDLVISFQVVEHVQDPTAFLQEARRVARRGGAVLVTTPNRDHRLEDGERPWNRYHVREFSPPELEALLRAVFEDVEIFGIRGSPRMETIERARVDRARKLARLDPL